MRWFGIAPPPPNKRLFEKHGPGDWILLTNVDLVTYGITTFALILIMGELKGQLFIIKQKIPRAQVPGGKVEELKQTV